ncbi:hypothetical protein [Rubinisphaera margarita]|uniref:hypothetical protein n=1 Tax=Rubinisphaera margarita TaxID=2909586 RepID=UPI001EE9A9D4|nr:hypothetical protein [Rubinisphaera margarita]MCG6156409.1 hypothetical protein [Rubinisphaera margarita]
MRSVKFQLKNEVNVLSFLPVSEHSSTPQMELIDYFSRFATYAERPFRIVVDLQQISQMTSREIDDLMAMGLVFVDYEGTVVFSGVGSELSDRFRSRNLYPHFLYASNVDQALSLF